MTAPLPAVRRLAKLLGTQNPHEALSAGAQVYVNFLSLTRRSGWLQGHISKQSDVDAAKAAKAREGKIRKEAVAVAAAGVKQMQTVMDLQSSQLASTKLSKANFLRTGVNQRASGVSGWLHKRGKLNTAFKRRFCKLRAENVDGREQLCLSYYKNKTDRKPRGEVIIGPKTPIKPSLMSPLEFTIATPDREFVFLAESRESFELWFFACNAFGLGEVEEPQEEDGKEDDGSADASNAAIDISRDR